MVKRSRAPKNFYTASQAIKKLGMPRATFFHFVKIGKIPRVVPQGYTEGYYPKSVIDKMALERELFTIQYSTDTSVFRKAEERDIQGIHDLSVSLFGANAPDYESRLAPYRRNPDIYYIIEQDGIMVGFLGIVPLKKEVIDRIIGETEKARSELLTATSEIITPENISSFEPGEAENVFLITVVRQGLSKSKYYGMKLISGAYEVLRSFARNGVVVKRFYATSRTPDGIRLCRELGFEEIVIPDNPVHRFRLDLATTSSPFLREHQQIIRELQGDQE